MQNESGSAQLHCYMHHYTVDVCSIRVLCVQLGLQKMQSSEVSAIQGLQKEGQWTLSVKSCMRCPAVKGCLLSGVPLYIVQNINVGCTTSWHIYDPGSLYNYIAYCNREMMVHILNSRN